MSDRLQELQRQRAAIQAHLAWLDREIQQAQPASLTTPQSSSSPSLLATPPASLSAPQFATPATNLTTPLSAAADPEAILAGYRQDPKFVRTDVRKGCLLYFFAAFAFLGLAIAIFYLVNTRIRASQEADPAPSGPVEQPAAAPSGR